MRINYALFFIRQRFYFHFVFMHLSQAIRDAFVLLFTGDGALWQIIGVSLKTSSIALLIATPICVAAGYAIATYSFTGRRVVIWLTQAALSLPTVLIGLLLYLTLSRHGPWGGLQWLFTQPGIIAGQVLIVLPVLIAFTLTDRDINYKGAMQLIDWITSVEGQKKISEFKLDGQQLFFPSADAK